MKIHIRKMGNSKGIIIPKPVLQQTGLCNEIELSVEGESIILSRPRKKPRHDWAAASQRIADAGDDQLEWPEFANEEDEDLQW